MNNKRDSLFLLCEYYYIGLMLDKFFEKDPNKDKLYLSFWVSEFDARQNNFWDRLRIKAKLLWKIITKGDYFLHELLLTRDQVEKLKEYINRF